MSILGDLFNKKKEKESHLLEKKFAKKIKSGLRKCPGHKFPKTPSYDERGMCSICLGYKKDE